MSTFKTFKNKLSTSDLIKYSLKQKEVQELNQINESFSNYKKEEGDTSFRSSLMETKYNREIANRETARFLSETRRRLLTKAMNILVNEAFEHDQTIESLIDRFIDEEGTGTILHHMSTKSLLLSEINLLIEKKIEDYKEKNIDKKTPMIIDPELEDEFSEEVKNLDIEKITNTIQDRVEKTIEEFIEKKVEEKERIMDIIDNIQSKIDNSLDEEVQESYNIIGKRRITEVHNKKSYSLFESMVRSISKKAVKDPLYSEFLTEGKLNVEAIIERATKIYSFLEFINTYQFKDINEEYILNIHNEMK